jgi:hypothetical protein
MTATTRLPTTSPAASAAKLDLMLDRLAARGLTGKLVFALDATMSRQPTWDQACQLQAEMFAEAASIGGLEIKVAYFRGKDELKASGWMTDAKALERAMTKIVCAGGYTQIERLLALVKREHDKTRIGALVFVGDAAEEHIETLSLAAQELNTRGVRVFMFQEDDDEEAEKAFREISRVTKGAYCKFSPGSAKELGELLRAVAAYAAGGLQALGRLEAQGKQGAITLLGQLR